MRNRNFIVVGLSCLVLLLVLGNILLMLGNQSLQISVAERQQYIAETIQLEALNRQVIAVLAEMAFKTNDGELKQLLAEVGVDLSPPAGPSGSKTPKAKGTGSK